MAPEIQYPESYEYRGLEAHWWGFETIYKDLRGHPLTFEKGYVKSRTYGENDTDNA